MPKSAEQAGEHGHQHCAHDGHARTGGELYHGELVVKRSTNFS